MKLSVFRRKRAYYKQKLWNWFFDDSAQIDFLNAEMFQNGKNSSNQWASCWSVKRLHFSTILPHLCLFDFVSKQKVKKFLWPETVFLFVFGTFFGINWMVFSGFFNNSFCYIQRVFNIKDSRGLFLITRTKQFGQGYKLNKLISGKTIWHFDSGWPSKAIISNIINWIHFVLLLNSKECFKCNKVCEKIRLIFAYHFSNEDGNLKFILQWNRSSTKLD